jgi:hypothetical protein
MTTMSRTESKTAMDGLRWLTTAAVIVATAWLIGSRRVDAMPADVQDALDAVAYVVVGGWILLQAARTRTQTRQVRDGWMGNTLLIGFKPFRGTHPEFVARYRRGLLGWGGTSLILGAILAGLTIAIIFIPAIRNDPMQYPLSAWGGVFFGLTLVAIGVVYLRCRRILNSPR